VEIVDGTTRTFAFSAATTPRSIAKQAGISVYPEDGIATVPAANFLTARTIGEQVIIDRAIPVNLNLYGTPAAIRTHAKTVKALLADKHIELAKDDTVQPAAETALTPSLQVFVTRKGVKIISETQTIPTPLQIIQDNGLTFGTTALRQQGSPGQQVVTYQVNLQNGVEVSRTVIQTVITVQPVAQIIARGQAVQIPADKQAVMAQAGIAASDYPYVNYIVSNESGWCPTKLQGQIGYCPGYAPAYMPPNLGYGLGQATPGTKMSPFGADWQTNPVTQLRWATSYADARYGSWNAAYNYWYAHHNW
jgi:resuscitation-promoting factor RpfB